jgi:hypothetical protein
MPVAQPFRPPSTQDRPFALPLREDDIQRAVFAHLKTRGAPGIVAFHPKNGGIHQRGRRRGINSGLGVLTGTADVIVIAPPAGRVYALELKGPKGKPTVDQLSFLDRVRAAGGEAACIEGLDAALAWLEARGILRGVAA